MSHAPAGWYPDPASADRDSPTERYWDGSAWSHQVRPRVGLTVSHGPRPDRPYVESHVPSTPDGQVLAGWWKRAGAVAADFFILLPILVLVAVPSLAAHWDSVTEWWNAGYAGNGSLATESSVPEPPVLDPSTTPGLVLYASLFSISVLYSLVFLRWKQATPGKLLVGLHVRLRAAPGRLAWTTIARRVGFVSALAVGAQVPVAGLGFLALAVLDYLWPIWDKDNQALHDKVARTNVVQAAVERHHEPGLPPPADVAFRAVAGRDAR